MRFFRFNIDQILNMGENNILRVGFHTNRLRSYFFNILLFKAAFFDLHFHFWRDKHSLDQQTRKSHHCKAKREWPIISLRSLFLSQSLSFKQLILLLEKNLEFDAQKTTKTYVFTGGLLLNLTRTGNAAHCTAPVNRILFVSSLANEHNLCVCVCV